MIDGAAKYTGSGELPSAGGGGKAFLTLDADTCAGDESAKGTLTYADRTALDYAEKGGVLFSAIIEKSGLCGEGLVPIVEGKAEPAECTCPGWPAVFGEYTSTNPELPGGGKFFACFYNQREGLISAELAGGTTIVERIGFGSGPYQRYINQGALRGSIKTQACASR